MAAVFKHHDDIAIKLLEGGAAPLIQDENQTNALLLAINENATSKVVFSLLNHVQSPHLLNDTDGHGETALSYAYKKKNVELVQKLLQKGADPNTQM
jgi:ankyrin repeat protein